jgi:predicted HNH restriction endonuclease
MTIEEKIYKSIRKNSNFIIQQGDLWSKELGGSKNYICTPDLKYWTFGKSVGADGEYHYNGGVAKRKLYSLGFINVLELEDSNFRRNVVNAFIEWADKVDKYPIKEKFERDQVENKRFELLLHRDVFKFKGGSLPQKKTKSNHQLYDEGFKREIIHEVSTRDRQLVELAKVTYGTTCCVCNFNFAEKYGSLGEGFIEVHHLYPISEGNRKNSIEDVKTVCANCHRMLHKGNKLISIEMLKEIVQRQKANKK